jgi:hypothetical protein
MKKLALLVFIYSRLMALPVWFEPNQGQAHPSVQFQSRNTFLRPTSASIHIHGSPIVFKLEHANANAHALWELQELLAMFRLLPSLLQQVGIALVRSCEGFVSDSYQPPLMPYKYGNLRSFGVACADRIKNYPVLFGSELSVLVHAPDDITLARYSNLAASRSGCLPSTT